MPNTISAAPPSAGTEAGAHEVEGSPAAAARIDEPTIEVEHVSKSFGPNPVLDDVSLRARHGQTVALLGPSGCGKTTLLRCIAGLEAIDSGSIRLNGREVSSGSTTLAPERRRIGMVFQDWALFPHMSVARNVAYGVPKGPDCAGRVQDALEMTGLEGLGDRMPSTLSGGQQQRVAIARALAPEPAVLLLDEPFSNLDTALRIQVRSEVNRLLRGLGVTTVFVTHDQEEAFVLGDEVAVMYQGRIAQQASPAELYRNPASAWVARFVGDANLLPGVLGDATVETAIGPIPCRAPARPEPARGDAVEVVVRPEQVSLELGGQAEVEVVEYYGHDALIFVTMPDGSSIRSRTPLATVAPGDRVTPRFAGGEAPAFALG